MARQKVPQSVLLDGAQMSLSALLAGTMGFLKARNIPINDWVSYIGEQFESSLADLEDESAERVMEHLLTLQVLPLGCKVISSRATGEKAEVTLESLSSRTVLEKFGTTPQELLRGFGVTQKEFKSIYAMFEPAAKAIGLRFTHQLKDGKQFLSLELVPPPVKAPLPKV